MSNLKSKSQEIRKKTFEAIYNAGGGHFGGSLSAVEIITTLYFEAMKIDKNDCNWKDRDRFILAKGHAGPLLYVILSEIGYIEKSRIAELDKNGGSLPKHVDRLKVEGIEYSSGPLGQGLSVACGIAAAMKSDKKDSRVYVLTGDGELDEGQIWEAAMTASHYKLDNLTAIVDRNLNQIDGTTEDVMALEPLADKWEAFGWNVINTDGHDTEKILTAINEAKNIKGKPSVIIANTVKGKGISFMEGQYKWHSGQISEEQFEIGLRDLEGGNK